MFYCVIDTFSFCYLPVIVLSDSYVNTDVSIVSDNATQEVCIIYTYVKSFIGLTISSIKDVIILEYQQLLMDYQD